jgi:toxin ParE1/3/4
MKIIWTAEAIERLKEIDAYISQDSPTAAEKFIDLLFERGESLKAFPHSGRKVPEYDLEDYRELIEGNYRIVYRVKPHAIEIETIFESHRLPPKKKDK